MPGYILVVSDAATRKSEQIEVQDAAARALLGLKVGDELDGTLIGLQGKIKITGGSDIAGIPMRPDVMGPGKRYVLLSGPPGYHPPSHGMRKRKLVRGNVITEDIRQINAVYVAKAEAKKEEKPAAAPKEVKPILPEKPEKKPEAKKERPEARKEVGREAPSKAEAEEEPKAPPREEKPGKPRRARKTTKKEAKTEST